MLRSLLLEDAPPAARLPLVRRPILRLDFCECYLVSWRSSRCFFAYSKQPRGGFSGHSRELKEEVDGTMDAAEMPSNRPA